VIGILILVFVFLAIPIALKLRGTLFVVIAIAFTAIGCSQSSNSRDQANFALSCIKGDFSAVSGALANEKVQIDSQNDDFGPCLVSASYRGNKEIVQMLIDKGANVEVRDRKGGTPLVYAIVADKPEIVKILLESGANPDVIVPDPDRKVSGISAFAIAKARGNQEIIQLLETAYSVKRK
jgi:ankyrin repeat protein